MLAPARFRRLASGALKEWDEPGPVVDRARVILARYPGTCMASRKPIQRGDRVTRQGSGWALASEVGL
jgi:hypothetical protein